MRQEPALEEKIAELLGDSQYENHPLRAPLETLLERYCAQVSQLERITSISDGYQSIMLDRHQTLNSRYEKQIRQLQKIVRISDQYQTIMHELNETLKTVSSQDSLTGLPNRRSMLERMNAEISVAQRHSQTFSIALLDIDHFKQVNDRFGHDVGDRTLVCIAHILNASLRAEDVCGRWGGEEFLVLLPHASGEEALQSAQRLCEAVSEFDCDGAIIDIKISTSVGVAQHRFGATLDETIKNADIALYDAKRDGRNRVVLFEDSDNEAAD